MRRALVLWAVLALPVGCSPGPESTPDASVTTPDPDLATPTGSEPDLATPDLMPPIPPVLGRIIDHHVLPTTTDNGTTVDQPRDLSGLTVAAYVRDGKGAYTTYPGKGSADGTFAIPAVPEGVPFSVRIGTRFVVDTISRDITLGEDRLGRPSAPLATKDVNLVLNVTNVAALTDSDDFGVFSPSVDASTGNLLSFTNDPPFPGDTRLLNIAFNYRAFQPSPRLYQGDPVYLTQLVGSLSGNTRTQTLARALGPTTLTVNDVAGIGGTLSGALAAVPQDQSIVLDWRRSAFAGALVTSVHPKAALAALDAYVVPRPGGYVRRARPFTPALLWLHTGTDLAGVPDSADLRTATLRYGNPFPGAWGQMGVAEATVSVNGQAFSGAALPGRIGYVTDLDSFKTAPIRPPLTPVTSLTLVVPAGDKDLRAKVFSAGLNPTLRWTAPATGSADRYQVRVIQRGDSALARDLEVAVIETTDTKITFPPDVFKLGVLHYLIVRAYKGSGPLLAGAPQAWADCISETIVP